MTRVAFVLAGRTGAWLGGLNYYRNLLGAIAHRQDTELEPVLFVGAGYDPATLEGFPAVETHREPMLDRGTVPWAARTAARGLGAIDAPLGRLLQRHGVDVLSHSGHLGLFRAVPAIGWVPDLQHRSLPHLFGRPMWLWRDAKYRALVRFAAHLLTSSQAGKEDLVDLSAAAEPKTTVLRFVVDPPTADLLPPDGLRRRHGLPERYLYLPNQFWVHKNHLLVLEALERLGDRAPHVVATGVPHDRRSPGHYDDLMRRAGRLGERFRVLGVVPYEDVTALLRDSVALLNPSLFEGWSTTVEEARSLGKRSLLSDIAVHREQSPPGSEFFDPHDAGSLAQAMTRAWAYDDAEGDRRLVEEAEAALPARRREFVETYEGAVRRTLAERR